MTFVSKGMGQISGKSHICNVKYGKLYDGEQHGVLVWCFDRSTLVLATFASVRSTMTDWCFFRINVRFSN